MLMMWIVKRSFSGTNDTVTNILCQSSMNRIRCRNRLDKNYFFTNIRRQLMERQHQHTICSGRRQQRQRRSSVESMVWISLGAYLIVFNGFHSYTASTAMAFNQKFPRIPTKRTHDNNQFTNCQRLFSTKSTNPQPPPPPPPKRRRQVVLRNATIDDLSLLQKWENEPHLSGPNVMGDEDYNDWNWEYELQRDSDENVQSWRRQLIAMAVINDNETIDETICTNDKLILVPIGFIQIIDPLNEEDHYWGMDCDPNLRALDIWIGNISYIGKGYGTQMMEEALKSGFVFGNPKVTAAIVDPMADNIQAHKFYTKLGFQPDSDIRYFGPDKCLVHRLTRKDYAKQKNK